jgi:hypothetical protein
MTGNIWMDLQMSLADIGAESPDMSGELPAYLPRVISGTPGRTRQTRNRFRLRRITVR